MRCAAVACVVLPFSYSISFFIRKVSIKLHGFKDQELSLSLHLGYQGLSNERKTLEFSINTYLRYVHMMKVLISRFLFVSRSSLKNVVYFTSGNDSLDIFNRDGRATSKARVLLVRSLTQSCMSSEKEGVLQQHFVATLKS